MLEAGIVLAYLLPVFFAAGFLDEYEAAPGSYWVALLWPLLPVLLAIMAAMEYGAVAARALQARADRKRLALAEVEAERARLLNVNEPDLLALEIEGLPRPSSEPIPIDVTGTELEAYSWPSR